MAQIIPAREGHNVVVIGSGAGGGTIAKVLTDLGIEVTLLEAGPMLDAAKDFKEHLWPYEVNHRGAGEGGKEYFGGYGPYVNYFSAPNASWDLPGEPYTVAEGTEFRWLRSRVLGGRTNSYARMALRFADYDFIPYSRDGLGADWPISYQDLAPYYDKADKFVGVTGSIEGIRSAPDGIFQQPPAPKVHDLLARKACERLSIRCIANRRAVITSVVNNRPPCHYCGQCGRGCITASNYSSSQTQILPALQSGKLTILDMAMVREILVDDEARVKAVLYIDKRTREERQINCRVVVLAASACESARLLLNSQSRRFPRGLANNSGVVGRYLTDSVGTRVAGYIPALEGLPRYDADGMSNSHVYMPWWLWDEHHKLDFPRGYHIEFGGGFQMPGVGSFHSAAEAHGSYGTSLKDHIRSQYGAVVGLSGRGEPIPNVNNYCELDPEVVDQWGIPVLRFHYRWSDYEHNQARHMVNTFQQIIETMGGRVVSSGGIAAPGTILHEVGTIRMGNDPRSSALNQYCQAHEVPNLFVADAAPFVSNPDKNPTHTIIALAWRTAEYLAEEMRRNSV